MRLVRFNDKYPQRGSLVNHFLGNEVLNDVGTISGGPRFSTPKVNIREIEDAFAIEVAAPGFDKNNFHVEVENNVLRIEATKEDVKDKEKYSHYEFTYGSFKRSFSLPENKVKEAKIEAKYENGILNILLPKKEEAKAQAKRLIDIA